MSASARAFRWLLHLYPAAFREEYGGEMTWAFTERLRTEPAWRVWPRTLADTLWTAAREHADVSHRDIRIGLRGLVHTPGLTLVTVLALALGVGVNTAVYTVVKQVLWEPLPYPDADRLVVVLQGGRGPVAPAIVADLRQQVPAFEDVAAAELWGPTWTGGAHPERLPAMRVSSNLFALLGVTPAIGRTLTAADTTGIVLSHRIWKERFGSDTAIVGREVLLEGEPHEVLGVMPPSFVFSPFWARAEVWGVLDLAGKRADRRGASLRTFARLSPGASLESARTQVTATSRRLRTTYPVAHRELALEAQSLQARVTGDVRPLLWTLLMAAGCVLLVTCVNVASLLLARAVQRQPEMAVRAALGGRSPAISRQLFTESLLLATAGAAAGLALACWLVAAVPALSHLGLPRMDAIGLDWEMALVALGLSVLTGLSFGLAPVWTTRRGLRLGVRGASESRPARQARAAFAVAQVTLAVLLVVVAGLLVRSFQHLSAADPGFTPEGLLAIEVSAHASPTWRTNRGDLFTQVIARVREVPGVIAAAAVNHVPLAGDAWGTQPLVEGRPTESRAHAVWRVASPGYLATAGIQLRAGREFSEQDVAGATMVVVVNDAFARQSFGGEAIGRRLSLSGDDETPEWRTVVGVVRDVRQQEWSSPAAPEIYVPFAQTPEYLSAPQPHVSSMTVVARTAGDPQRAAAGIRAAIWSVDADLAQSTPLALAEEAARQMWRPRFATLLVSAFGGLALLLAATGIYGVVAHDAGRRTREIGIRLALGAPARGIRTMVLLRGVRLVVGGVGLGILIAATGTQRLQHVLFGISPLDVVVFGTTALLFLLVGLVASGLPAWRAARVEPVRALRSE